MTKHMIESSLKHDPDMFLGFKVKFVANKKSPVPIKFTGFIIRKEEQWIERAYFYAHGKRTRLLIANDHFGAFLVGLDEHTILPLYQRQMGHVVLKQEFVKLVYRRVKKHKKWGKVMMARLLGC
jgi:hypothetical protein